LAAAGAIASLRATVAELGGGLAALYALHRLLQVLHIGRVVPYTLVAQPIGIGVYAGVRDDPATTMQIAGPGSAVSADFPRPAVINALRWAAGATCHACQVKGRFAGTIWIQRSRYEEDEVRCDYLLPAGDSCVWDFDVYVAPEFRAGRTMARLWKAVDTSLAGQGVRWSMSRISRFNSASLRSHQRLGAVEIGRLTFFVIGPWQLMWDGGARRARLSSPAQARPTVRLQLPARGP
jgi:hypothetical protein